MKPERLLRAVLAAVFLLAALPPGRGLAATPIVIDGQFADWVGKAHLEDPMGDTKQSWDDVRYWYWATNDGESAIFFMIERFPKHYQGFDSDGQIGDETAPGWPSPPVFEIPYSQGMTSSEIKKLLDDMEDYYDDFFDDFFGDGDNDDIEALLKEKKEVYYTIFVDATNNGQFGDVGDAVIFADYYPKYMGFTLVSVFVRTGSQWSRETYGGIWGEDQFEGGLRCEFRVAFSALNIEPGQALRLVLFAQDKRKDLASPDPISEYEALVAKQKADRVPDLGDLQWAPVSTLGRFGWLALLLAGTVMPFAARRRRPSPGGHDR